MFERVRARAAVDYGLTSAVGVALPLLVGALLGHVSEGAWCALGAYFLVNSAPDGPYGLPAWRLWASLGMLAVMVGFGAVLAGHPWLAVGCVPVVAALSVVVPWVGFTAPLILVVTAGQPPGTDFRLLAVCELVGGLGMVCLMLLPFERRIQRPIRTSVSAAARDVADLLVPASSAATDWDEARAEAAQAFVKARAAHDLSRPVEGSDRAERLIDALARVLHEAVTLRALCSDRALRTPFADERPPVEIDEAIAYQAARLRGLADAIENGHVLPESETRTLDRLAGRIEELRREWADDSAEHVGVFVLQQVRRSLARIGSTVDSAARLAGDLTFERAPLHLPGRPHPVETAGNALTHMADGSPKFRYATRLAVATGVGMVGLAVFHPPHGNWLPMSALLTTRDTYSETVSRVTRRIGGTVAGGTVAAIVLQTAHDKVLLALVVFCFALAAFSFRHVGYGVWVLLMTPTVMTIIDFAGPIGWDAAVIRILLNVAGAMIGLAAGRLLWPRAGAALVPGRLDRLRDTHADLVRSVTARFDGKPDDFDDAYTRARLAATDLAAARDRLAAEPVPDTDRIAALQAQLAASQRIRDRLLTLHRLLPEGPFDPGPVPEILDKVADAMDERTTPQLSSLLTDLDTYLADLARGRRRELLAGATLDETTPLRRALLHAAAVRHAVRGLAQDPLG